MKKFKKLVAGAIAMATLAVSMAGFSASAGTTGNPSTWSLYQTANATGKYTATGVLVPLRRNDVKFEIVGTSGGKVVTCKTLNPNLCASYGATVTISTTGVFAGINLKSDWVIINGGNNLTYQVSTPTGGLFNVGGKTH